MSNQDVVAWAAQLGEKTAEHSARHDREGTFVEEAYEAIRESGYLAIAVPEELGGNGATIREVTLAQCELAQHCASTALAVSMHLHITMFAAWRYRRGMPGAETLLRRVVDERVAIVSTGGADFTRPNGTAERVEGGWKLNGRKVFCSQAPAGDLASALFTAEDEDGNRTVLSVILPMRAPGVEIVETWDTLGMRGTASHDIQIDDVFVPEEAVGPPRPWGVMDPPLAAIICHAMPVVTGVYLGVATTARDHALAAVKGTARADDPLLQRQVGLMDTKLRVARWALLSAIDEVGDDPAPTHENVATMLAAKRQVAEEGVAVCDLAMEVAGGRGYFRSSPIEQCYRDIRAVKYHPLTPEQSLLHAGRLALGVPHDEW